MGIRETLVIYLLIGAVVGVALALREGESRALRRGLMGLAGVAFWPLFAPLLLGGTHRGAPSTSSAGTVAFDARIRFAEEQLASSLARVEGVAEEVVAPEVARVRRLAGSMASMERRVREMDELLASREFDAQVAAEALSGLALREVREDDPRVQSVKSRLRNIERLKAMRGRTGDDLERIILKLEEMSSQIRLLKFAGRSDAEVVRMIKEISDCVEEATEGLLAAS